MEFGVFDHLDRGDLPLKEYYEERLKVIEAYDRGGFYAYHVAEHHSERTCLMDPVQAHDMETVASGTLGPGFSMGLAHP